VQAPEKIIEGIDLKVSLFPPETPNNNELRHSETLKER